LTVSFAVPFFRLRFSPPKVNEFEGAGSGEVTVAWTGNLNPVNGPQGIVVPGAISPELKRYLSSTSAVWTPQLPLIWSRPIMSPAWTGMLAE
jgi:hypothetical protein